LSFSRSSIILSSFSSSFAEFEFLVEALLIVLLTNKKKEKTNRMIRIKTTHISAIENTLYRSILIPPLPIFEYDATIKQKIRLN